VDKFWDWLVGILLAIAITLGSLWVIDVVFLPKRYECWQGTIVSYVEPDEDKQDDVYIKRDDTDYLVAVWSYSLVVHGLAQGDSVVVCRRLTPIFSMPITWRVSPVS